jgi:2-polyprenyl-3-methyl-5-hydroxy-6-metoxy-1,4-benzoquinol methylase
MPNNNKCPLCGNHDSSVKHKGTRDIPDINVLTCNSCGATYLSSFSQIDNNFYEDSKMHDYEDPSMDKWRTITAEDDKRRFECLVDLLKGKIILDFGCGNGGFLNLTARIAEKAEGCELDLLPRNYLQGEGFNIYGSLDEVELKFDVITMFHVLEHLKTPVEYLKKLSSKLKDNGKLIIEVPNADDALIKLYDCRSFEDFTYWSCHLILYNESTLEHLANLAGLKVSWCRQIQRYPLANHLYWLAKGEPGGHKHYDFLSSSELNQAYEKVLREQKNCDTILCSMEKL